MVVEWLQVWFAECSRWKMNSKIVFSQKTVEPSARSQGSIYTVPAGRFGFPILSPPAVPLRSKDGPRVSTRGPLKVLQVFNTVFTPLTQLQYHARGLLCPTIKKQFKVLSNITVRPARGLV